MSVLREAPVITQTTTRTNFHAQIFYIQIVFTKKISMEILLALDLTVIRK